MTELVQIQTDFLNDLRCRIKGAATVSNMTSTERDILWRIVRLCRDHGDEIEQQLSREALMFHQRSDR